MNDASGIRVGWLDLVTGQDTIEQTDLTDAFKAAVAPYCVPRQGQPQEPVPPTEKPRPKVVPAVAPPGAVEPEWHDLALNRPGQAVRAKAEELRAEMQQRSRIGAFVLRAIDAKTDERAFRVGAQGEEAVGPRPERLTKHGWHVLHSVPVGSRGSDIDHVLIGPGGVYTINTKRHPGGKVWVGEHAIRVNGQRTDYLRNSRFEADRTRKILLRETGLELPVRAVLIFLTDTLIPQVTIKQTPPDVLVLDRMDIPGIFKRAPRRIDDETIEQVFTVARRSTSWTF